MRISVTEDDITCGQRGSPDECPVARAVKRAVKRIDDVYVEALFYNIFIEYECELTLRFNVPPEIRAWIRRYDDALECLPVSFTLEGPCLQTLNTRLDPAESASSSRAQCPNT